MTEKLVEIVWESWSVLGQMAPYLLFGFLVAGVLSVCISPEFVERHLGGRGFQPVVNAALFGVPLPLCSCGVIPVGAAFRRHGASRAATTSFLLSTPQTGVDSIAVTYAILGLGFAVYRPLIALATGILGGLLVMLFAETERPVDAGASKPKPCGETCCTNRARQGVARRVLEYGLVVLPRDIGVAILLGVVIAGAIGVFVPAKAWHPYLGGGIVSMLLATAVGIPLYVCASASVPIAAGLIHAGASPGAVLAFLIAGPATNAATITTLWKLLGGRSALLYMGTIVFSAVGGGLLLDVLLPDMTIDLHGMTEHHHEAAVEWIGSAWAAALLAVLAVSYAKMPRRAENTATPSDTNIDPRPFDSRIELRIEGMTCLHCVETVTQALLACAGVASAQVDLSSRRASVVGRSLTVSQLIAAVSAAGYDAKSTE
jgi:uncharacterized protein